MAPLGASLAVSAWSGQRFGLVSVDLAEFSLLYQSPLTVPFVGFRPDGSTVTMEFVTDGVIDGSGPLADFQTFYFDSRFADLVRVEVPTYGWSLDNMVFSQVPEPATGALLFVGGLLLWALRACLRTAHSVGRGVPAEPDLSLAAGSPGTVRPTQICSPRRISGSCLMKRQPPATSGTGNRPRTRLRRTPSSRPTGVPACTSSRTPRTHAVSSALAGSGR